MAHTSGDLYVLVAVATRVSGETQLSVPQPLFSPMKVLALGCVSAVACQLIINANQRILEIDGSDYDVDSVFTDTAIANIRELIAKGLSSGQKVGILEQIMTTMYEHSICWDEWSPPEQTGVHPGNRSTFGVGGTDSQHLGFDILSVGWSWTECKDATAVQAPPAPALNKESREYNDMLIDVNDGLIPALPLMRCLTIAGGHTNVFLRQVNGRVPCILGKSSEYSDADGNLNPEQLSINRPLFAEALRKGLNYRMLHWQVPYIFPEFVEFAQSALNTKVRTGQSEIEILLVLHQLASPATARGEKVNWPRIEAQACKSMPACKAWIGSLRAYVAANSGGTEGQLLKELAQFAKTFGSGETGSSRVLGSEFISKLAGLNFGTGTRCPYVVNACIETQLVSPAHKLVDGFCKLLAPTSLNELTKKESKLAITEAERAMTQGRALCDKLNITGKNKIKCIGKLDVRLISFICKKGRDFEGRDFQSIAEIIEVFLADVSKIVGKTIAFSGESTSAPASAPAAAAASAAHVVPKIGLQSVAQMHSKVHQAKELGFITGAHIIERGVDEPQIWEIKGYNGDTVDILKCELGRHTGDRSVEVAELLESWRLHKGNVTTMLPSYDFANRSFSPLSSVAWKYDVAKAAVSIALRSVFDKFEPMANGLDIFSKPTMVQSNVDIPAGSLMLAPATTRIDRRDSATAIAVGRFDLGGDKVEPLYISPQFTAPLNNTGEPNKQPFVCHFWQLTNAESKQEANLALRCLIQDVNGTEVRVPILVNAKEISAGSELAWDKSSSKQFPAIRTMVSFEQYAKAAKRRKLS